MFVGLVVRWMLIDVVDGARMEVVRTFAEALARCRELCELPGVTKVSMQRIEHELTMAGDTECEICEAIYWLDAEPEAPACGVCDGMGHDTYNCRVGDAPYDYRDDMIMDGGLYGM